MAKPRVKTYPYAIYYTDGSYMIYDITKQDYESLKTGIEEGKAVETTVGFLATKDIRSIIEQKPQPKKKEEKEKPAVPDMSIEEMQFLKQTLSTIYDEDDEEVDFQ